MLNQFESCVTCNNPEGCETLFALLVGEATMMTGLTSLISFASKEHNQTYSSAVAALEDSYSDTYEKLQTLGCVYTPNQIRAIVATELG